MNFVVFYQIFETFALPAILPWIFMSLMLQSNIWLRGADRPAELVNPIVLSVLFNILSIVSTLGYVIFEIFRRRANKIIYHKEN